MHVSHVELVNFRNYRHLEVDLAPRTTLLWGANAAGKTSFLEALYMLATTRSRRAGAERQLIHWDTPIQLGMPPFARVVAEVQKKASELTLEMTIQRKFDAQGELSGRCQKRFQANRRSISTRAAAGRLRVVLFEPEDLNLITGSPARRRRYLDDTLMQVDTDYWRSLRRYQRVLRQRNQLLRSWREGEPPSGAREQVAFWNREMVQHGAYLIVARHRFIEAISQMMTPLHGRLTGAAEPLTLAYRSHVPCSPQEDVEGVAYDFRQAMAERWPRELERGMTLLGPHRDDVDFVLGSIDLATYGSRGQQRTATVTLKLAEVDWLDQQSGEAPVILLDDVLSELDPERQGYLQGWLLEGLYQVLVTTTDLANFRPIIIDQAAVYKIEAGGWRRDQRDRAAPVPPEEPSPPSSV